MATDACQFFYDCKRWQAAEIQGGRLLFCSFGSMTWHPDRNDAARLLPPE